MTSALAFSALPLIVEEPHPLSHASRARVAPPEESIAVRASDSLLSANQQRVVHAAKAILHHGEQLLGSVSPAQYSARSTMVFNGSIGGHYRHCLDHFTSLLRAIGDDIVDYDHRDRDLRIETEPAFAQHVTRDLKARLNLLNCETLAALVTARCEVSYEHGDSPATASSFAREMAYCIAHAIHHFALISVIARLNDVTLPADFGVAPSTLAHLARQSQ